MNRRRGAAAAAVIGLMVLAFTVGTAVATGNLKVFSNPDVGLTAEEVQARHQANSDAFWTRYADWVDEQNASGRDPRTYNVTQSLASIVDPPPTLSEAHRRADAVFVGRVDRVQFRASADTVVSITASEVAKGDERAVFEVLLPVALMPQDDETWSPAIEVVEGIPMLYPGDEVVIFASREPAAPNLVTPQPWTGVYHVRDGVVRAIPGNRLAARVDGTAVAEFLDMVREIN